MADSAVWSGRRCRRESKWLPARRRLRGAAPAAVWDWLLDASSLTRRLQLICGGRFHVRVLQQAWGRPMASERRALALKRGERVLVREVHLMCGERPWVFARTVIPVRSLRGAQRRLARLGNRPLGAALFADPRVRRGEVEVAHIGPEERLFARAVATASRPEAIWGRRSVFWLQGKSLLVSEIFLPALFRDQVRDRHSSQGIVRTAPRLPAKVLNAV
jgi:chorismate--pyruvate lyase